jgi:hypothetical protein
MVALTYRGLLCASIELIPPDDRALCVATENVCRHVYAQAQGAQVHTFSCERVAEWRFERVEMLIHPPLVSRCNKHQLSLPK